MTVSSLDPTAVTLRQAITAIRQHNLTALKNSTDHSQPRDGRVAGDFQ